MAMRHAFGYRMDVHPKPAAGPALPRPGAAANHQDPVTTSHLPGNEPGSVAKARTAARARASDSKEIP